MVMDPVTGINARSSAHETVPPRRGYTAAPRVTACARARLIGRWTPCVEVDERALVERCLAGNQAACETLVELYARLVGTVIWRAIGNIDVVEDLAQETFLRVFR